MPVDSQIALQGKPPVIPELDLPRTFLTLAQYRALQTQASALQARAAREQTLFDETSTGGRLLSSLRTSQPGTPATPAQPGLAPLSPHQAAPGQANALAPEVGMVVNPGTGTTYETYPPEGRAAQPAAPGKPAGRQRSILDPDVQAELYELAPHVAADLLKEGLNTHTSTIEGKQKLYASIARPLSMVHDDASYQAWRTVASTVLPPEFVAHVPSHYTGPELITKMQRAAQDLDTQFSQQLEQSKVEVSRMEARTRQQAEQRQEREDVPITGPEGTRMVPRYRQPGSTGGALPAPIPGTAPAMAPGAAAAAGNEQSAIEAHTVLTDLEASNTVGGWQQLLSAVPGVGGYLTPHAVQRYQQAQRQFMEAIGGGDPAQYFAQPGDHGFGKDRQKNFEALLAQKKAARDAALAKLRIQTNRPAGLTPPGQTQATPGGQPQAPAPGGAGRSPHAGIPVGQLTPTQMAEEEAYLRQQLGGR